MHGMPDFSGGGGGGGGGVSVRATCSFVCLLHLNILLINEFSNLSCSIISTT